MKKQFVISLMGGALLLASGCGYNQLQTLDEGVKASWAEVENQYQRRHDLVPNLVETVKGSSRHEKETLQAVVEARAKATQTKVEIKDLGDVEKMKQFQAAQAGLSGALSKLLVVAENYPDLKANAAFRDLQAQLEGTENRIAVARRRYIESVSEYNQGIRHFPTNLTAKYLLDLKIRETLAVSEDVKTNPKVTF